MTDRTRKAARRLREDFTIWNWLRALFWKQALGLALTVFIGNPNNKGTNKRK